jgi:ubiquinol-cytochrome c reductase cytochrome b subunit
MLNWLDQRTGFVTLTKDFLTEDVPGGASYWYAFGSATVFAMILQIVTGIFLTFYYSPSAATAWESTKYIIEKVPALLGRDRDDRVPDDAHAASAAVGRV